VRLDKFLKVAGIIRRRTVAKDIAEAGRITVDGRPAKGSTTVRPGQRITLDLGRKTVTYEVLSVPEGPVPREMARELTRLVAERINDLW